MRGLFARVAAVESPIADPPGNEWHMAVGALLAFGIEGALTDTETRQWDATAQAEAKRLGSNPDVAIPNRDPARRPPEAA